MVMLGFGFPENSTGGPHFSDVEPGSTFYTHIETLYNLGILNGYADGTYRSNNSVSRGQIAKLVVNAGILADPIHWQLADPPTNTFADVPTDSIYFRYVETAAAYNLVAGYECGGADEPCDPQNRSYYRVNAAATRAQLSKIIYLGIMYPSQRK